MQSMGVFKSRLFQTFKKLFPLDRRKTMFTNLSPLNIAENSIIISQSRDIFENLALEDWIYTNYDMAQRNMSILLLWYNSPSVVIGRHQNPWVECCVNFCEANGVNVVRRNSGGGTVYHDFGNLNLSFITSRKSYNRKRNLELICDSVRKRWPVELNVTARDDIVYGTYKLSGTASKIGRNTAYHHCTILVNVDKDCLRLALDRSYLTGVESKATSSVRSNIINLSSICPDIDIIGVIKAVSENFKQINEIDDSNVLCLHPNEQLCPGFDTFKEKLQSWSWRFGKTPLFTVTRSFPLSLLTSSESTRLEILLKVDKGAIQNISLSPSLLKEDDLKYLNQCLQGSPFTIQASAHLDKWMESKRDDLLCHFIKSCVIETILSVYR